jgi:hypothetical protein
MVLFPAVSGRPLASSLRGGERPDASGRRVSHTGTKQKHLNPAAAEFPTRVGLAKQWR